MIYQIQSQEFEGIPRKEWQSHVGKVVMYCIDNPKSLYYTGILNGIKDNNATFRNITWREPAFDGQMFGRLSETHSLDSICKMIEHAFTPGDQIREFEGSTKFE